MTPHRRGRWAASLAFCALISLAMPLAASAHSELDTASPANGSTVSGTPAEIVLTFSAALNPTKSSIVLVDSTGTQVAKAAVDPANDNVMRLTPPTLEPGAYEVDWTSVALDGDLLRGKVTFTVAAPSPSPSPTVAPSASASVAPTPVATVSPPASSPPTPSPVASGASTPASASSADVFVPVLVAIVIVAGLGGMLLRGRRGGGTR